MAQRVKISFEKIYGDRLFPPCKRPSPEDTLWRLQPEISRGFSKNERIPILRDKPVDLIKR